MCIILKENQSLWIGKWYSTYNTKCNGLIEIILYDFKKDYYNTIAFITTYVKKKDEIKIRERKRQEIQVHKNLENTLLLMCYFEGSSSIDFRMPLNDQKIKEGNYYIYRPFDCGNVDFEKSIENKLNDKEYDESKCILV